MASALAGERFDILVVGGGIYGAWTAYDAALRGLRVALVEKNDWGSGTSQASSKLIHGGLRYLEHFELGLVRKALRERRVLARLAGHRVHPLRLVLPVAAGSRLHRLKLRCGLWLYDRLAGPRQRALHHESLRPDQAAARYPFLDRHALAAAFVFGDCRTDDARLTLDVVLAARKAGAVAVNHAPVERLLSDRHGRVHGAVVRHGPEADDAIEVEAGLVIHTTGPFLDQLAPRPDGRRSLRLTKGVHLVLPPLPTRDGVLSFAVDGRVFFILPWYGRTLLGTTDTDYCGDPAAATVEPGDVDYLLAAANRVLEQPWSEADVLAGFAGLRALQDSPTGSPGSVTRDWDWELRRPGLLCSLGGKLTTARVEAARLVDAACTGIGRTELAGRRPTDASPLPMAPMAPVPAGPPGFLTLCDEVAAAAGRLPLPPDSVPLLAERYGTGYGAILDLVEGEPALGKPLLEGLPFCRAEVIHAVRAEMARTLEDVLRRRVPILVLDRVPRKVTADAASLMGRELGWSEERQAHEVAALGVEPAGPSVHRAPDNTRSARSSRS